MSLLSRLAPYVGGFKETVGTEALGLVLTDVDASAALISALRVGFPDLPGPLRFVTQSSDEESRPDVVGLSGDREVLHIEGKFWAGLTTAQAENYYFDRLLREHARDGAQACNGILLWVVPRGRAATMWEEVVDLAGGQDEHPAGSTWRFARRSNGQGVALVDWFVLCDRLESAGTPALAEDVRQLRDYVEEVDNQAFLPWTIEQLTDQAGARRQVALHDLAREVRTTGQKRGVLDGSQRNKGSSSGIASGFVIRPGGFWTALLVDPGLHANYGRSPLWLRWWDGATVAREALRDNGLVELRDGCAVPVPIKAGLLREQVVDDVLTWLTNVGQRLAAEKGKQDQRGLPGHTAAVGGPEIESSDEDE